MLRLATIFTAALAGAFAAIGLGLAVVATGLISVDNTPDRASTTAPTGETDTRPASGSTRTVGQVYEEDGQGVAFIQASPGGSAEAGQTDPLGGGGTATGSGFLIDDAGHLLTNAHVVDGASEVSVTFGEGEPLNAEVLGADNSTDVAVLEVDPTDLSATPLELGDSTAVKVGDPAIAIGNPYGLDRTVTSGIISALQRQISAPNGFTISDVLQTDAAINPGNSGGPLIDFGGRVIGINSQIATGGSSTGSVGIGFAVPIETARSAAEQIIESGSVEHAYLGIAGGDAPDGGAELGTITPDGPAAAAGLEEGDVVTAIDGEEIDGIDDVINAVDGYLPGDEVTLTVERNGSAEEIAVTLGDRPETVQG